jgi:prevent-host-death family protein
VPEVRTMTRTIPHRELRNNSSAILRDVAAGERIRITNHGVVVAVLVPPSEADRVAPHIQPARIRGGWNELRQVRLDHPVQEDLDELRGDR